MTSSPKSDRQKPLWFHVQVESVLYIGKFVEPWLIRFTSSVSVPLVSDKRNASSLLFDRDSRCSHIRNHQTRGRCDRSNLGSLNSYTIQGVQTRRSKDLVFWYRESFLTAEKFVQSELLQFNERVSQRLRDAFEAVPICFLIGSLGATVVDSECSSKCLLRRSVRYCGKSTTVCC